MEALIANHNQSESTAPHWGATILTEFRNSFRFQYSSEVEKMECLPDEMLTLAGMFISENSLKDVWGKEEEGEWEQYLID